MLIDIEIESSRAVARDLAAAELRAELPGVPVRAIAVHPRPEATAITARGAAVQVGVAAWNASTFDPTALDDVIARVPRGRDFRLAILDDGAAPDLPLAAIQIATRCQRHLDTRNRHSSVPLFDRILERHLALHDLRKPLVAADHEHARDTWRWVLRLAPDAALAVQVAALFHDVERLASESDVRVEQDAVDYEAFKRAHAAAGARMTRDLLDELGAPTTLSARVAALVEQHERPDGDADRQLLTDADALSFFSLNAPGFARYYGPRHTERKVAYTLSRLSARGRQALARVRHRADIAALLARGAEQAA